KKYLISPFFNEHKHLIRLFEFIHKRILKNAKKTAFDKKVIWKFLFGDKPYKDVQMRRLFSDLNQLVNGFLAYHEYQKSPALESIFLMNSLQYSELDKQFEGAFRLANLQQEKSEKRNTDFHFHQFLIEKSYHEHIEFKGLKNLTFEHLESADYQLDCFYITQKLKHYCDSLGYDNFLSKKVDIHFFSSFLSDIENSNFINEASIKSYFLVSKMLLHPDDELYFHELKNFLLKNQNLFEKSELTIFYTHLINFCIDKKINIGNSDFYKNLFEIYKDTLIREIIFVNNEITLNHYKNIITVGVHIKEFEWVENFIQNYTPKLPKNHQENALTYNLAKVFFSKKDYLKVIEQLREVEYKTLIYALGGKLMLLKTYYELNEIAALDSLIDSFRIYLRRNRTISKDVRQQYMNVLRFVKKLSGLAPYDKAGLAKVTKEIHACKALADKNWILEKVGEF
ncbi:MAG: hypothetical protein ACI9JY_002936, partial [Saprospiraceae bacterium]